MTARCADKSKQTLNSHTSTQDRMTLSWLNSTGRYGRRCWTNIFSPKFLHVPLGVGGWPLGYEERRCWANCSRNQFTRFSTCVVMIHQTNVTDRRTDRQTTCDCKIALCTTVHRAVKTEQSYRLRCVCSRLSVSSRTSWSDWICWSSRWQTVPAHPQEWQSYCLSSLLPPKSDNHCNLCKKYHDRITEKQFYLFDCNFIVLLLHQDCY